MKNKNILFLLALFTIFSVGTVSYAASNGNSQGIQKRDGTGFESRGGRGAPQGQMMGNGPVAGNPFVRGEITNIDGDSITITSSPMPIDKDNDKTKEDAIYTVDISSAKFYSDGETSDSSMLSVGDTIMIEGEVDGTSIKATTVHEGNMGNGNRANIDNQNQTKNNRSVWSRIGNFFGSIFGRNKNK